MKEKTRRELELHKEQLADESHDLFNRHDIEAQHEDKRHRSQFDKDPLHTYGIPQQEIFSAGRDAYFSNRNTTETPRQYRQPLNVSKKHYLEQHMKNIKICMKLQIGQLRALERMLMI